MASLICCRAQEDTNRKPSNMKIVIGPPQDFRHVSHYGDNDSQIINKLPQNMSSKCGEGYLSQSFHLECIDLKERNGTVLGDISNNENHNEIVNKTSVLNKSFNGPPKFAPPPPPTISHH